MVCDAVVMETGDRSRDGSNLKYRADCDLWLMAYGILGGGRRWGMQTAKSTWLISAISKCSDADCETYVAYISHFNTFGCRGEPRH